jgi:hypothetical protein
MRYRALVRLLVAAFLASPTMGALAQSYSAIAVDPTDTKRWGWSTNYPSRTEAENAATNQCSAQNCRVMIDVSPGECGAISFAGNGAFGAAA